MARKQTLPTDQLDRLNERYRRERDALVALTNVGIAAEEAARQVDAANDRLEEAHRQEREAYQRVVALVGAAAAAELCGGPPIGNTTRRCRSSRRRGQGTATAATGRTQHETSGRADDVATQ